MLNRLTAGLVMPDADFNQRRDGNCNMPYLTTDKTLSEGGIGIQGNDIQKERKIPLDIVGL